MPTFVVTTLDDEENLDDVLSLREALAQAAASGEPSTIVFDSSLVGGTIALGGSQLVVASNVTIDGDIDGDGSADITISGEGLSRVMYVNNSLAQVELNGLVLTGGKGIGGGGGLAIGVNSNVIIRHSVIRDNAENGSGGGGIYGSAVTLTIEDSTISGNSSDWFGGGIRLVGAGSVLNVVNSTVSNNVTTGGGAHGGGIQYAGLSLHIENSTISGNAVQGAGSIGGGLRITTSDSATIYNSTIVGNAASASAGGVSANGVNDTFVNVVVAGNTSGAGASAATGGSPLASGGSPDDVSGVIENSTHSYFGTTVTITNDVNSYVNQGIGSLFLGNLQNNGGYVETHALLEGSALINAGSAADLPADRFDLDGDGDVAEPLSLDGRGGGRVAGDGVDIGAFEHNRAPVLADGIADQTINEDMPWSFVVPAGTFSDADGDSLVLSATLDDNSALPAWLSFYADSGTFSGTPPQNFNGQIDLKVTASDGTASVSDTFTLTVNSVNDAPIGSPTAALPDGRMFRDYTIHESDLLAGFSDPDGETLTIESLSVSEGTLTNNGDGTWTWEPPLFFTGEVELAYQVSDGTAPPIDASQSFEIVLPSDDGGEEPPVSVIKGTPEADNLPGTDGNDVFKPIEGDDDVFGGDGDDSVILPGDADGYVFVQLANGQVGVVDSDPSDGDQGSDVLDGIELIRFGDENGTDTPLASLIDMGQPAWTLESVEVGLVAATWQLFMQMAPSEAGFEYLILSDVNPHDLTDPYYARFNAENKYINFTTNMATGNPTGAAWFEREFGNLSYEEAVEKAFNLIITEDALLAAGGDPEASKQFFLDAKGFYAQVAAERIVPGGVDLAYATNITLLSSVLFAAVLADVGPYGAAVNNFVDQVVRVGTSNEFLHDLLAA